jgi:hypothetical protein
MHNWYQPIASWYGMTRTPFSYTAPEVSPGERVLEVALSNFELGPGRVLYVLVSSKLVDPGSGRVRRPAQQSAQHGSLAEVGRPCGCRYRGNTRILSLR